MPWPPEWIGFLWPTHTDPCFLFVGSNYRLGSMTVSLISACPAGMNELETLRWGPASQPGAAGNEPFLFRPGNRWLHQLLSAPPDPGPSTTCPPSLLSHCLGTGEGWNRQRVAPGILSWAPRTLLAVWAPKRRSGSDRPPWSLVPFPPSHAALQVFLSDKAVDVVPLPHHPQST